MYLLSFLMSNHHIAGLCGIAPPFTLLDHTSRPLSTIPTPLAHSAPFLHLFLAAAGVRPWQQQLAAVLGFHQILLLLDRRHALRGFLSSSPTLPGMLPVWFSHPFVC
jgi:hypothetical protein